MNKLKRTYSEMLQYDNFGDRLEYLKLRGEHHLSPRALGYDFYHSHAWRKCRKDIIDRDAGCDLGLIKFGIDGDITVHHINPLTPEDLDNWNVDKLFNPENLITVSDDTHKAIHYKQKSEAIVDRQPGDLKLS